MTALDVEALAAGVVVNEARADHDYPGEPGVLARIESAREVLAVVSYSIAATCCDGDAPAASMLRGWAGARDDLVRWTAIHRQLEQGHQATAALLHSAIKARRYHDMLDQARSTTTETVDLSRDGAQALPDFGALGTI